MRILMLMIWLLFMKSATAADQPSLLLYISPQEYKHEVSIGMKPYYSRWVARGPALEQAARKTLSAHFRNVDVCEGNKAGDVIATLSPQLSYNPAPGRYYAKVKVAFHTGDGRLLGTLKATGQRDASIVSSFIEEDVRLAYEDAMQHIAELYSADTAMQENLRQALQADFTHMPCEMVGMIPGK